jgi:hypothetical protein
VTDPTGTYAQHPALLTVAGSAAPPQAGDPTGTDAAHPAIVTRPGGDPRPQPVVAPAASHRKKRHRHKRHKHKRRHRRHRPA